MRKFSYEKIKSEFQNENLVLSDDSYYDHIDSKTLTYTCNKGHTVTTSYRIWKQNKGCKICNIEKGYKKRRLSYDFVKSQFEKEGFTLLSKTYENSQSKLDVICNNGHKTSIAYNNFMAGRRCDKCARITHANKIRLSYDFVKSQFEKENYTLLSKNYINSATRMKCSCSSGHICYISYNKFSQDRRCPKCYGNISKPEEYIFNVLSEYTDCIQSDKKLIHPLELDIVIPNKKLAIEYCGLYWHSEERGKNRNYHLNKLNECNKQGYNLITIFEDEWVQNKDIIINRLKNRLGVTENEKIYARKCNVTELSTCSDFLNRNHTQGNSQSKIKLGLIYEDKLVSVMTFSNLSVAKGSKSEDGCFELNRYCSDYNYSVIGGASKLFSYFVKNYNPKEVISFADRRWSSGNLYNKLGFKFLYHTKPNYWYLVRNKSYYTRKHRFMFRKSVLQNKLDKFNPDLTEYKNMTENGYTRIWDCGNSKYLWRN